MRKLLRIGGLIVLNTIGGVLVVISAVMLGWAWAILVLMQKIRLGPPSLWNDQAARHDFGVRKIELKVAGGSLACYISVALIAITLPFEGTMPDWMRMLIVVPAFFVLLFVSLPLAMIWREEWRHAHILLESRIAAPVLF